MSLVSHFNFLFSVFYLTFYCCLYVHINFRQLKLRNHLWELFEIWYEGLALWVVSCVRLLWMSHVNFLFTGLTLSFASENVSSAKTQQLLIGMIWNLVYGLTTMRCIVCVNFIGKFYCCLYIHINFRQLKLSNHLWELLEICYEGSALWVVSCVQLLWMSLVNFLFTGLKLSFASENFCQLKLSNYSLEWFEILYRLNYYGLYRVHFSLSRSFISISLSIDKFYLSVHMYIQSKLLVQARHLCVSTLVKMCGGIRVPWTLCSLKVSESCILHKNNDLSTILQSI